MGSHSWVPNKNLYNPVKEIITPKADTDAMNLWRTEQISMKIWEHAHVTQVGNKWDTVSAPYYAGASCGQTAIWM